MSTDQRLSCLVHGAGVERDRQPPHAIALQRRWRAARKDAVTVVACRGAVAGIEIVSGKRALDDGDRRRTQMEVQRLADAEWLPALHEVEMRHLAQRVNARIRAAGTAHTRRLSREAKQRIFERPLHGRTLRLALPAEERRAVVFNGDAVAGHGCLQGGAPTMRAAHP